MAVLGGGLPVGALFAVVVVLVVTRRRYRRPMLASVRRVGGGESSCGIATLADAAEADVMNNRRRTSPPPPQKTRSMYGSGSSGSGDDCVSAGSKSTKDLVGDAMTTTQSTSGKHAALPPGRCAKVSNVDRQRSTRAPDATAGRGLCLSLIIIPADSVV